MVLNGLTLLTALIHLYFFYLERFMITGPVGAKVFGIDKACLSQVVPWAANQGVYNLLLGFGLIWCVLDDETHGLRAFLLIYIASVGVYGALTVNNRIFFIQSLPALLALIALVAHWAHPMINDVRTSFEADLSFPSEESRGVPKELQDAQRIHYPQLRPLHLNLPTHEVFQLVRDTIENLGYQVVFAKDEELTLHAVASTKWLAFKDDVLIKISPSHDGTLIQMRSRSRLGRSDFGTNARRIRELMDQIWVQTL